MKKKKKKIPCLLKHRKMAKKTQQHVETYGPQLEDVTSLKLEPKLLPTYRAAPHCITLEFGII